TVTKDDSDWLSRDCEGVKETGSALRMVSLRVSDQTPMITAAITAVVVHRIFTRVSYGLCCSSVMNFFIFILWLRGGLYDAIGFSGEVFCCYGNFFFFPIFFTVFF